MAVDNHQGHRVCDTAHAIEPDDEAQIVGIEIQRAQGEIFGRGEILTIALGAAQKLIRGRPIILGVIILGVGLIN